MGLFDKLKNKSKEEVVETKEEVKEKEDSITEDANYMLSSVKEKDIQEVSLSFDINKLIEINDSFKEYYGVFSKDKKTDNSLYQINGFVGANELVDFFSDPKNKSKAKKLKQLGFNPATIMMTAVLSEIEKDVTEIKEISKKILTFLESESEAKIESSIKALNSLVSEYKYNWDDEQFINVNYNQVKNIKKEANDKIIQYQKLIQANLNKNSLLMINKTINDNQNELEKNFSYYRLALYVYSFSTFMDVMLLENFKEPFLKEKIDELNGLNDEYNSLYQKALDYVSKSANKSIEGNVLSITGEAGKALGGLLKKVDSIKEKKVDSWFNEKGDSLKNISQDMKDKFKDKFTELSDSHIKVFIDKIQMMSKMCNNTKNIYFDKEKIYLEMVK